jgi:hypothetical protein
MEIERHCCIKRCSAILTARSLVSQRPRRPQKCSGASDPPSKGMRRRAGGLLHGKISRQDHRLRLNATVPLGFASRSDEAPDRKRMRRCEFSRSGSARCHRGGLNG